MKTYHTPNQLRIVGKAYEVRWQLRRLMETSINPQEPLLKRLSDWRIGEHTASTCKIIPFPQTIGTNVR